ncbi:MAG: hypothetical protein GY705_28660 [Bacteroidetes bacterium]|nr:hypothetical protein [Bacteroidota bacterium]
MNRNNYNIKINPPQPSSEEIAKHKDFDGLLKHYHSSSPNPSKLPANKIALYAGSIAAIAATIFLAIFLTPTLFNSDNTITEDAFFASHKFVDAPIPPLDPVSESYTIIAEEGGTLEINTGSKIVIPEMAFMNDRGKLVEGEVQIFYREFHDPVDFFRAGIPMDYDSAGVKYQLESAGMIELLAEKDGERINIAPSQAIDIELPSEILVPQNGNAPEFNIYYLDTLKRNWVYMDRDEMEFNDPEPSIFDEFLKEEIPIEMAAEMEALETRQAEAIVSMEKSIPFPIAPKRPRQFEEGASSIELDFLTDNIKESDNAADALFKETYEGTIWQVMEKKTAFNENLANFTWEKWDLKKLDDQNFQITFTRGEHSMELIVTPVLLGEDYENAMTKFEDEYTKYKQNIKDQLALREIEKDRLQKQLEEEKALMAMKYEEQINTLKAKGNDYAAADMMIRKKVVNRFRATGLGFWNCDRPLPPYIEQIFCDFTDQHGNNYDNRIGYLVDKNQNTVYRFLAQKRTPLRVNTKAENLIWFVNPDNKLAILQPEEFKFSEDEKKEITFVMNLEQDPIESEEDIRRVLEL